MPIKIWYLWSATKSANSTGLMDGERGGTKRDPTKAAPALITHAMPDQVPNRSNRISRLVVEFVVMFVPFAQPWADMLAVITVMVDHCPAVIAPSTVRSAR